MINDIYVLDKNLELIGIADGYKSCIWANRYNDLGDCEVYIQATTENLQMFAIGNYLMRMDDEMICVIKQIELDTSTEEGNFIIVTGSDAKCILQQRIIWGLSICKAEVESYIRQIVTDAFINPTDPDRIMYKPNGDPLLYLGELSGFTESANEQVSYANVGEKIQEYCKQFGWGYRIILRETSLYFELYKGTDRSDWVVFSPDYENLDTTQYVEDASNLGNVALIAGSGEGADRATEVLGSAKSTGRYEVYIDARDLNRKIKYSDLVTAYPGGSIVSVSNKYYYNVPELRVQIYTDSQRSELITKYPTGHIEFINDIEYFVVYNVGIAEVYSASPSDNDDSVLLDIVYDTYLLSRGVDKLSGYGLKITFDGTIEPNVTFMYKKDYFLGDIVTVENEYGVSLEARIVEIVEVNDDNGYSVEPKFEYISIGQED